MALIDAKLHVDPANDAAEVIVDLVGVDPFQHEFLKQVFADALCATEDELDAKGQPAVPHGKALGPEDLRVRFVVKKTGAAEDARRIVKGLPTVAQEAEANAKAEADAEAAKQKAAADAKAAEDKEAADKKAAADFELEKARVTGEAIGRAMGGAQKQS